MTIQPNEYGLKPRSGADALGLPAVASLPVKIQPDHWSNSQFADSRMHISADIDIAELDSADVYVMISEITSRSGDGNVHDVEIDVGSGDHQWGLDELPIRSEEDGKYWVEDNTNYGANDTCPTVSVTNTIFGLTDASTDTLVASAVCQHTEKDIGYKEVDTDALRCQLIQRYDDTERLYDSYRPLSAWLMMWAGVYTLNCLNHQSGDVAVVPLMYETTATPVT